MKKNTFKKLTVAILAVLTLAAASSCAKNTGNPSKGPGNGDPGNTGTGKHVVDPRLPGTWMWSSVGDGAWYDNNGVYNGPSYGLALQYTIESDGSGTAYSHLYSSIGAGSSLEVNIASTGFFETDNQAHLGYFPISGTYESTGSAGGQARNLDASELWNPKTNTGKSFLYQQLVFKTTGGRDCFEVTSSDGVVDTYFKVK